MNHGGDSGEPRREGEEQRPEGEEPDLGAQRLAEQLLRVPDDDPVDEHEANLNEATARFRLMMQTQSALFAPDMTEQDVERAAQAADRAAAGYMEFMQTHPRVTREEVLGHYGETTPPETRPHFPPLPEEE